MTHYTYSYTTAYTLYLEKLWDICHIKSKVTQVVKDLYFFSRGKFAEKQKTEQYKESPLEQFTYWDTISIY